MNKAQSNIIPNTFGIHNRKRLINFNLETVTVQDEQGSHTEYSYEQISIPMVNTRGDMISAVINNKYPRHQELALINNKIAEPDNVEYQNEYAEYQERREFAKNLIDNILQYTDEELENMEVSEL